MSDAADEHNRSEIESGRLTPAHITALVKMFQQVNALRRDGKFGPATLAKLERRMVKP